MSSLTNKALNTGSVTNKALSRPCAHCGVIINVIASQQARKRFCSTVCRYSHPFSEETKIRLALARRRNNPRLGRRHSEESKKKMSLGNQGRIPWNKGKKMGPEFRAKIAGPLANNWQGGKTKENDRIRKSVDFRLWREAVFARDNWTCQSCSTRGGVLHPHHVKSFALFPELRFAIDNGQTLCAPCHYKTETWGRQVSVQEKSI